MHLVPVQSRTPGEVDHFAVHPGAKEALPEELFEEFPVMAFPTADDRSEDQHLLSVVLLAIRSTICFSV
jgi:hypothetical protein